MLDNLFTPRQWALPQVQKENLILGEVNKLNFHHYNNCVPYKNIIDKLWGGAQQYSALEDVPFLPVQIFKSHLLASIQDSQKRIVMTSSGTTGSAPSKIIVDDVTARLQSKALTNVVTSVLGQKRRPMLVLDTRAVIRTPSLLSARGAGILGMMKYGRNHEFALNEDLTLNRDAIHKFLQEHEGQEIFMFGFTFMVWLYLYEALEDSDFDLSKATLIHSGGWKKLADRAVDNEVFRQALTKRTGVRRIFNFYGMVEQMGSIFLEGEEGGGLYAPDVTDVIIRDPISLHPVPVGQEGLIQVISVLPHSYPGQSILTEDLGRIISIDSGIGGRLGKAISISGRLPKSELRGCSDVHADNLHEINQRTVAAS